MSNLLRNVGLPDMGVGYQKFQAGSPDGYLDFGVISTPEGHNIKMKGETCYLSSLVHIFKCNTVRN